MTDAIKSNKGKINCGSGFSSSSDIGMTPMASMAEYTVCGSSCMMVWSRDRMASNLVGSSLGDN